MVQQVSVRASPTNPFCAQRLRFEARSLASTFYQYRLLYQCAHLFGLLVPRKTPLAHEDEQKKSKAI